jgi:hypothetical protein
LKWHDIDLLVNDVIDWLKKSYLLTELRPSWGAANCAATQELMEPECSILCSQEPSTGPNLNHMNPIHAISSYLSKIHSNIVHPPTWWSSQWSLSFWLSHQYSTCIHLLPHSCYIPCPSHSPWLDRSNYAARRVQVMKLLIMQFLKILHNINKPFK